MCSISSGGSASASSDGSKEAFRIDGDGFHVAADGIDVLVSSIEITRPSAKAASASAAAAAIAWALSNLNCFRSALRLAVTSSEVSSKRKRPEHMMPSRTKSGLTPASCASTIGKPRDPTRLAAREVTFPKETAPPKNHAVLWVSDPDRTRDRIENAFASRVQHTRRGNTEEPQGCDRESVLNPREDNRERICVDKIVLISLATSFLL
jgi:hypothetical protein